MDTKALIALASVVCGTVRKFLRSSFRSFTFSVLVVGIHLQGGASNLVQKRTISYRLKYGLYNNEIRYNLNFGHELAGLPAFPLSHRAGDSSVILGSREFRRMSGWKCPPALKRNSDNSSFRGHKWPLFHQESQNSSTPGASPGVSFLFCAEATRRRKPARASARRVCTRAVGFSASLMEL